MELYWQEETKVLLEKRVTVQLLPYKHQKDWRGNEPGPPRSVACDYPPNMPNDYTKTDLNLQMVCNK